MTSETVAEKPWWETEKPPSSMVYEPGYVVPTIAELLQMPTALRGRHIEQVIFHDQRKGTHVYDDYLRARDRCTHKDQDGRQCSKMRWDQASTCLAHASIDELDPAGARERRTRAAKLRMLELLEAGVDQLEHMITAPDDEITPGVRLNAITALFDRVGLPKEQNQTVQAHIITEDYSTAGNTVRERLQLLSESYVNSQLAEIEASQDAIEGETDDGSDH
jgi:hypothetical protein